MDRVQWMHQYKRLLTAFGKKTNQEQSSEYFLALQPHPSSCIHDAVTSAIREAKYWPTAADLVERARLATHAHRVPTAVCDVCSGSTWTQHQCTPETPCGGHPGYTVERVPIFHPNPKDTEWLERPYVHAYARRCYQCWTMEPAA